MSKQGDFIYSQCEAKLNPLESSQKTQIQVINASTRISRADLADFILTQVNDEKFVFQMPFLSY